MGQFLSSLLDGEKVDSEPTSRRHPKVVQQVDPGYWRPEGLHYPSTRNSLNTAYQRDLSYTPSTSSSTSSTSTRYLNTVHKKDLRVEVKRDSCRTASVHWTLVQDSQVDISIARVTGGTRTETPQKYRRPATERAFRIPTQLMRGKEYKVIVRGVTTHAQDTTSFRAVFTPAELQTLHEMAMRHVTRGRGNKFQYCNVFYRNKLFSYYTECQRNNNIMTVYMKDNNGDPASIVNGQIKGLFFATSVDPQTGQPPTWSFFGPRRISLPATEMLTWNSNLYFADFYCNDKAHYVTVVLTRPGSQTDRFCKENLIKLDIKRNNFLWRNNQVHYSKKVWVEVFFTEDVDLSSPLCSFSTVEGRGTSKPGGLPKNPTCGKCNLPYPPLTPAQPALYRENSCTAFADWSQ